MKINKRLHLFIYGGVTGVGFRAWTERFARKLGVAGWVRNASPYTVEVLAEGPENKLRELLKRCQAGPDIAWVEKVEAVWDEATGEYSDFSIRR